MIDQLNKICEPILRIKHGDKFCHILLSPLFVFLAYLAGAQFDGMVVTALFVATSKEVIDWKFRTGVFDWYDLVVTFVSGALFAYVMYANGYVELFLYEFDVKPNLTLGE